MLLCTVAELLASLWRHVHEVVRLNGNELADSLEPSVDKQNVANEQLLRMCSRCGDSNVSGAQPQKPVAEDVLAEFLKHCSTRIMIPFALAHQAHLADLSRPDAEIVEASVDQGLVDP